jgi:hypothetical protein
MAKRRKNKTLPARQGELATMERQRQQGGVVSEVVDRDLRGNVYIKRHKARFECMLDSYRWHGNLTEAEYEAGMRFRRAYLRAVFRLTVDDPNSTSAYDHEMAMLMVPISEQILRDAYGVITPAQQAIIVSVCGHDECAGKTDRIETLHRGLERLADHWKMR